MSHVQTKFERDPNFRTWALKWRDQVRSIVGETYPELAANALRLIRENTPPSMDPLDMAWFTFASSAADAKAHAEAMVALAALADELERIENESIA